MKIQTYVINLKRSADRREYILKETARYACMDVELVEAVDGYRLLPEETERLFDVKRFTYRYKRYPYPGEIGCGLSHQECYRRLLKSDEEVALILEDDIVFLKPELVDAVMTECCEMLKKEKGGVFIYSLLSVSSTRGRDMGNGYSMYRVWFGLGAYVYLIHRNVAKKLLTDFPSVLADDYQYMNLKGIKVYGLSPLFSTGDSMGTNIQQGKQDIEYVTDIPVRYRLQNFFRGGCRRLLLLLHILSVR